MDWGNRGHSQQWLCRCSSFPTHLLPSIQTSATYGHKCPFGSRRQVNTTFTFPGTPVWSLATHRMQQSSCLQQLSVTSYLAGAEPKRPMLSFMAQDGGGVPSPHSPGPDLAHPPSTMAQAARKSRHWGQFPPNVPSLCRPA